MYEFVLKNNFNIVCPELKNEWKHDADNNLLHKSYIKTFIVKNPYAWFVSIFKYATKENYKRIKRFGLQKQNTFDEFLKLPYVWDTPENFQKSKTPIHHWNLLNKHWLKNCFFIKYEDLIINTKNTLEYISNKIKLPQSTKIKWPLKEMKPGDGLRKVKHFILNDNQNNNEYYTYHKENNYLNWYDQKSIKYINDTIDTELMEIFKYNFFAL